MHIVDIAAQSGHDGVVSALIAAGASVDPAMDDGRTSLILYTEWPRWCGECFDRSGCECRPGEETEHIVDVAAQNGHDSVVSALISAGASVDQVEEDGCTPLFTAAQNGHDSVVVLDLSGCECRPGEEDEAHCCSLRHRGPW